MFRMVHQNPFVLTEEKRKVLETGGGTKEATKAIRKGFGNNFVAYCETREEAFLTNPENAPEWWGAPEGEGREPKSMAGVAIEQNAQLLGTYFKNWLWEKQVPDCAPIPTTE